MDKDREKRTRSMSRCNDHLVKRDYCQEQKTMSEDVFH